jgi:hypothetical protein
MTDLTVRTAELESLRVEVRACVVGEGGRGLKAGKNTDWEAMLSKTRSVK